MGNYNSDGESRAQIRAACQPVHGSDTVIHGQSPARIQHEAVVCVEHQAKSLQEAHSDCIKPRKFMEFMK